MEQNANPNLSPAITHQPSILGGAEFVSRMFNNLQEISLQGIIDNQRDARRRSSNDAFIDHLISTSAASALLNATQDSDDSTVTSTQAGQGTLTTASAAEETANAGTAVASQTVTTSLGNLLTATANVMAASGGVVTAQSLASILPVLVNAIGGASTPSQTQPKPAA